MKKYIHPFMLFFFLIGIFTSCEEKDTSVIDIKTDTVDPMDYYTEKHRPQFHFTPAEKWMNDPNGMVYYEGEYHLFFQYYPEDIVWGPMHWGHSVSKDLVHWEHLPIALYPDSLGYIFSGSAVIDWKNTSQLGTNGNPPMIAIFTHHDPVGEKAGKIDFQYQSLAYSNDKGRTWTKYKGNPIVPNPGIRDFRDPKVIWEEDSNQWVMVFAAWDHVKFYGSANLIDWNHLSDFGKEWGTHAGVWECPDLFPMTVEGTGEKKWVLLQSLNPGAINGGSGTQYFVGDFDGKNFTLDTAFAKVFGKIDAYVPNGIVFEDFEKEYNNWVAEGEAFGKQPAGGVLSDQNLVKGYDGKGLVNSYFNGDKTTGKLTSKEFTIEKDFINFLIGGGNDQSRTVMKLMVDGKAVRSAAGSNKEELDWKGWEVADFKGKKAHLEIIDTHPGGWGHIMVDQIMFADELATPASAKAVWLDYGRDNYAGVTWSDVPQKNGRRLFMGWMSNWSYAQNVPTKEWRSAMTLPRELVLENTEQGLRVFSKPVNELKRLRETQANFVFSENEIIEEKELSSLLGKTGLWEIELEFEIPKTMVDVECGIEIYNDQGEKVTIGFQAKSNQFFIDRKKSRNEFDFSNVFASKDFAPRFEKGNKVKMHLFIDVASVEFFGDDGRTAMTSNFFPTKEFTKVKWYSNGKVNLSQGNIYELRSTWR